MKVFILLSLLTLGPPAHAQEFYFPNLESQDVLPVFTQQECVTTLQNSLYPESMVKQGLAALLANQTNDSRDSSLACLDDMLKTWQTTFPVSEPKPLDLTRPKSLVEMGLNDHLNLPFQLSVTFAESQNPNPRPVDEAYAKSRCYNPHMPGTDTHETYAKSYSSTCDGKWLTDAEGKAALAAHMVAQERYSRDHHQYQIERGRYQDIFQTPGFFEGVNVKRVQELVDESRCFTFYDPVPNMFRAERSLCTVWLKRDRWDAIQAELKAIMGEPWKQWERKKAELRDNERIQARKAAAANPERTRNHGLRHLFSEFRRYLARGGKNLPEFCAQNEARQTRERRFQEYRPLYGPQPGLNLGRVMPIAEKLGLSFAEVIAIGAFTNNYFRNVNNALRKGTLTDEEDVFKSALEGALSRLPPYRETPVLRYVTLPTGALAEHDLGKTVCYPAFSSTSRRDNWTWGFNPHKFLIYLKDGGRLVRDFSAHPNEEEVALKAGACFKVIGRTEKEGGKKIDFVLAESDKDGNVVAQVPEEKK